MRACSLRLVGLGFRVREGEVSVRDRVGVRVSNGVRASTFGYSYRKVLCWKPTFFQLNIKSKGVINMEEMRPLPSQKKLLIGSATLIKSPFNTCAAEARKPAFYPYLSMHHLQCYATLMCF